jgi:hypothetical protein
VATAGKKWRHVIINTKSSWLHGDERGFRNRGHRIHSSGDYKHRPPKGEHLGLNGHMLGKSRAEIHLDPKLRPVIGRALIASLQGMGHQVLTVAVTKVHAHFLVELPDNILKIKAIVGEAKRKASRAVKRELPGSIWAEGGTYKPIKSRGHQRSAYKYILCDQGPGAWTWSFKDRTQDGCAGRKRP